MIKLTKTMLEKSIIDCNKACRDVALHCGVGFATMAPGDRDIVPAMINGAGSEVRFYRTNTARGDRRISIKGLKQVAGIGDTVILYAGSGGVITVTVIK